MDTPPPDLMAEISKDFEHIRTKRTLRLGLFCLAALGITLGFGFHWATEIPGIERWFFWASLATFVGAGVVLCALAFGWRLPTRQHLRPLPWVGVGLGGVILALSIRTEAEHLPFFHGAMCLSTGLVGAGVVLVLALLLGRKVLRRHAPTGLLLGVGSGLLGLLPLHLACGHASADHLMVWHALVPILGGMLGAASWFLVPHKRSPRA